MVGSIQEMQGKERKAIFISTVRSSNHWKEHDRVHELGKREKEFLQLSLNAASLNL